MSSNLPPKFLSELMDNVHKNVYDTLQIVIAMKDDIEKLEKQSKLDILNEAHKHLVEVRKENPEMTLCDAIEYIGDIYETMRCDYMVSKSPQ